MPCSGSGTISIIEGTFRGYTRIEKISRHMKKQRQNPRGNSRQGFDTFCDFLYLSSLLFIDCLQMIHQSDKNLIY
jgi:septin family protein